MEPEQTPQQRIAELEAKLAEAHEEIRLLTIARDRFEKSFKAQQRLHEQAVSERKEARLIGKAPKEPKESKNG